MAASTESRQDEVPEPLADAEAMDVDQEKSAEVQSLEDDLETLRELHIKVRPSCLRRVARVLTETRSAVSALSCLDCSILSMMSSLRHVSLIHLEYVAKNSR